MTTSTTATLCPVTDFDSSAADSSCAPAEAAAAATSARSLFDLVLRDSAGLDALLLSEARQGRALEGLLLLALVGLLLHGVLVGVAASLALRSGALAGWQYLLGSHPARSIPLALTGGFLAALGVCLPSFYFFTQLSGMDASFRLVTAQAVRILARTSVHLLGVLPFYAAVALSRAVSDVISATEVLVLGLALPFFVGLFGIAALYRSFRALVQILPITHVRRGDFLLRMVLAWGAVFSTVAPVALYRFAEALACFL